MKAFIGSVVCAAALIAGVVPGSAAPQAPAAGGQSASAADARISQRLKADPTLNQYRQNVTVPPTWTRVEDPRPCATARFNRRKAAANHTEPPYPHFTI